MKKVQVIRLIFAVLLVVNYGVVSVRVAQAQAKQVYKISFCTREA